MHVSLPHCLDQICSRQLQAPCGTYELQGVWVH